MMVLPLTTAGAKRETNASRGLSSGHAIPITPTGSLMQTVQPYSIVSCEGCEYIGEEGEGGGRRRRRGQGIVDMHQNSKVTIVT